MDSKNKTMNACETGLCSCNNLNSAGCYGNKAESKAAEEPLEDIRRLQWWLEHSQRQTARLWELLDDYLDEATQSEILEQLGRNCAISLEVAQQYIGNPDGFFRYMYEHSGEKINYDRDAGIITVITAERDCDCKLVNSKHISPIYCNCSKGWQKQTYEIILGKKVEVEVVEAVIRGAKRCVFQITVLDEVIE